MGRVPDRAVRLSRRGADHPGRTSAGREPATGSPPITARRESARDGAASPQPTARSPSRDRRIAATSVTPDRRPRADRLGDRCRGHHLPADRRTAGQTTSKYALAIFAAKRARQINDYYSRLSEGLLEYVGPLVDPMPKEKPLSIALREINAGLLDHAEGE